MKILMIETSGYGGLWHYTDCLSRALAREEGLELVLVTDPQYEFKNEKRNYDIVPMKLIGTSYIRAVCRLVKEIILQKPDIIHVQSLVSARKDWLLFLLARIFGVKLILTAHNLMPHDQKEQKAFAMSYIYKIIFKLSYRIITHFECNKRKLVDNFAISKDKIFVIPHGNYLFQEKKSKRYDKATAREILNIDLDSKVCLFFGAIREYKGILDILPVFERMVKKDPKQLLLIAGKTRDNTRVAIEDYLKKSDVGERIVLVDSYLKFEDLGLYFDCSDLVLFPYQNSYGSGALQTAFAFSKAVIVSDIEGFDEMVEEGLNGFFFKAKSVNGWVDQLLNITGLEQEELDRLGQKAYEIAKNEFSWERIANITKERVYDKSICKNK